MLARFFIDSPRSPAHPMAKVLSGLLLLFAYSALCWLAFSQSLKNWDQVWGYRVTFLNGWAATIGISAAALVLSTIVGSLAALARRSSFLPLRYTAVAYVETVRGLPLVVLVLFGFYSIANAVGWNDRISVGIVILSLFSGAYIAEIIRAGIESVGRSQWDSARAIGLTTAQTYRFVIFPQVMRQILPPVAGQFSSLIKDSSLLYIIGIPELTFAANQINSATYSTFESFVPLGVCYLVLTLPVSLWTKYLEAKVRYET
ncbi:MAG: amino acid ABC transporter permease [Proteobacteria bacterium]|nr:amino acid ABC transporter permease [Pseudomonadota bacterium]